MITVECLQKDYQITRTVLLPAATIGYWKINALPAGNRPEITVKLNMAQNTWI